MARTITEMAESAYHLPQCSGWLYSDEFEDVEHGKKIRREAYCKGANDVLEEVSHIMCVSVNGELETNLDTLIKELKGK